MIVGLLGFVATEGLAMRGAGIASVLLIWLSYLDNERQAVDDARDIEDLADLEDWIEDRE